MPTPVMAPAPEFSASVEEQALGPLTIAVLERKLQTLRMHQLVAEADALLQAGEQRQVLENLHPLAFPDDGIKGE